MRATPNLAGIVALGLLVEATFSGCATIERPALVSEDVLPLDALTQSINCEIRDAIGDQIASHPWIRTWQGQYTITLKANQVAYLKATANTFPVVLPRASVLNFGLGAGATTTASRTALYKFNIEFARVPEATCAAPRRPDGHPFLQGEIGFRAWIDRAIRAAGGSNGAADPDKLVSIGHTFEFTLDYNAAVSPSFVLMPTPVATANPTASFERVEDNIVDVSFGKVAPGMTTVTDTSRLPSRAQQREIEQARAKRRDDAAVIASNAKTLGETGNKALLVDADMLTALQVQAGDMTIQSSSPEVAAARKGMISGLTDRLSGKQDEIRRLRELRTASAAAEADDRTQAESIRRVESDPKLTRTTVRQVAGPAPALPADANPNVSGTMLQLQLERLVSSRSGLP